MLINKKDLKNILDYIPNEIFQLKSDFKNEISFGNNLTRLILNQEELKLEILSLLNL